MVTTLLDPRKRKCLADFGIVPQCLAPSRVNDQYLTNLLLKINAKLDGMNFLLQIEDAPSISLMSRVPTIILGMDVSHGSPGQADHTSIAAVVSSGQWPLISKYRASVHMQSAKLEMIDSLFKPKVTADVPVDEWIISKELYVDFYSSSAKTKPDHVIIFKDVVSESQFSQVLNNELDQIMVGTTRPTQFHVLLDQIGFTPDDLLELVHSLAYVCTNLLCPSGCNPGGSIYAITTNVNFLFASEATPLEVVLQCRSYLASMRKVRKFLLLN
ncbi:Argonaute family protein [Rhynchospora pubera]|uniref:Argonaute family protein n=1 Tax=Rhynchospora pubera TaxID=906938 RepID=A0AAV8FU81_9POAL|nr:Argonaute family protein [Rhynchospora pubera]